MICKHLPRVVLGLLLGLGGSTALADGQGAHPHHDAGHHHDDGHEHAHEGAAAPHGAPGHHAHWAAPPEAAARANPVPPSESSLASGRQLFRTYCSNCHGAGGRGDGPAAADLRPAPVDLTVMAPMHSDGDLAWKIANGRGPMPAWRHVLEERQIWDLVNHIKSLGSGG